MSTDTLLVVKFFALNVQKSHNLFCDMLLLQKYRINSLVHYECLYSNLIVEPKHFAKRESHEQQP